MFYKQKIFLILNTNYFTSVILYNVWMYQLTQKSYFLQQRKQTLNIYLPKAYDKKRTERLS